MTRDLRFVLQFNYAGGSEAALQTVQALLTDATRERGALIYKGNVLQFQKNPLRGESEDEYDFEISAFPLLDQDIAHQRLVLQEVRTALHSLASDLNLLAEDEILQDER